MFSAKHVRKFPKTCTCFPEFEWRVFIALIISYLRNVVKQALYCGYFLFLKDILLGNYK